MADIHQLFDGMIATGHSTTKTEALLDQRIIRTRPWRTVSLPATRMT